MNNIFNNYVNSNNDFYKVYDNNLGMGVIVCFSYECGVVVIYEECCKEYNFNDFINDKNIKIEERNLIKSKIKDGLEFGECSYYINYRRFNELNDIVRYNILVEYKKCKDINNYNNVVGHYVRSKNRCRYSADEERIMNKNENFMESCLNKKWEDNNREDDREELRKEYEMRGWLYGLNY